ncbi:hypothetical protein ACFE04_025170 [Oxalis oulophora]
MFSSIRGVVVKSLNNNNNTIGIGVGVGIGVRHFSRKAAVNVRKINPKVPITEAYSIAESLYNVIKQHGPLNISNTWTQAKDAGVNGLMSKTHMKIMLKWMRGRKMLKLLCTQVGSNKKFLHSTLPDDDSLTNDQSITPSDPKPPPKSKNPPRKQIRRTK